MQTTSAAFTAAEKANYRTIAENLQVSWHRQTTIGNRTFTIGVSTIGGPDVIGINPGATGSPANYRYFDESAYVLSLAWERGLSMPQGGLTSALAEATLDNTSLRFLPRYAGGNSEIATAILPRRPMIINAGFKVNGADYAISQFAGLSDQPEVNIRDRQIRLKASDYIRFFSEKKLDRSAIFTSTFTDVIMKSLLMSQLGMSTAEFRLDAGINIVPFGIFDVGSNFADIIGQLVEAENGHFYQDESGIFRFENRQHWSNAPYNQVQKVILTSMVIDQNITDDSHIVNVVEINAGLMQKQPEQTIFALPALSYIRVPANSSVDQIFEFANPLLALTEPTSGGSLSYFVANSSSDGSGTNYSDNVTFTNLGTFTKAVKYRIANSLAVDVYIVQLVLSGRSVITPSTLYYKQQDDSSVTAYQEQKITINNDFIQSQSLAQTLAGMILNDFSDPTNLTKITIRAMPDLQLGDLISWQGRYWRIFNMATTLDPSQGFMQELTLLQRNTIKTYFRIGISTIGGSDLISP